MSNTPLKSTAKAPERRDPAIARAASPAPAAVHDGKGVPDKHHGHGGLYTVENGIRTQVHVTQSSFEKVEK